MAGSEAQGTAVGHLAPIHWTSFSPTAGLGHGSIGLSEFGQCPPAKPSWVQDCRALGTSVNICLRQARTDPRLFAELVWRCVPRTGGTGGIAAFVAVQRYARLAGSAKRFKHPEACYLAAELPARRTGKLNIGDLTLRFFTGSMLTLAAWNHDRLVAAL